MPGVKCYMQQAENMGSVDTQMYSFSLQGKDRSNSLFILSWNWILTEAATCTACLNTKLAYDCIKVEADTIKDEDDAGNVWDVMRHCFKLQVIPGPLNLNKLLLLQFNFKTE